LRFCIELEKEFPRQVHCEFSIDKSSRHDWGQGPTPLATGQKPGREVVDIVISNLDGLAADDTAQQNFRTRTHEAFIEVKWLKKGWAHGRFELRASLRERPAQPQPRGPMSVGNYLATSGDSCWPLTAPVGTKPRGRRVRI
jgi:hypothetical protein